MRVVWSPAALREVERVFDYLAAFNPRAAAAVSAALIEAGDSLENFPYRGRQVPRSQMREILTAYPYLIRYRIVGETVRILRVRHTARRPTNP
jgi:plasmid stabilization system protein ParE